MTITESAGDIQVQMQFNNTDVSTGTCYIDRVRVIQSSPFTKAGLTHPITVNFSPAIGAGSLGSEASGREKLARKETKRRRTAVEAGCGQGFGEAGVTEGAHSCER
eukprot:COSAG01_NODE_115_length_25561_cov_103.183450_11_plen_106_part_00